MWNHFRSIAWWSNFTWRWFKWGYFPASNLNLLRGSRYWFILFMIAVVNFLDIFYFCFLQVSWWQSFTLWLGDVSQLFLCFQSFCSIWIWCDAVLEFEWLWDFNYILTYERMWTWLDCLFDINFDLWCWFLSWCLSITHRSYCKISNIYRLFHSREFIIGLYSLRFTVFRSLILLDSWFRYPLLWFWSWGRVIRSSIFWGYIWLFI